jgi:hypothetical protein
MLNQPASVSTNHPEYIDKWCRVSRFHRNPLKQLVIQQLPKRYYQFYIRTTSIAL